MNKLSQNISSLITDTLPVLILAVFLLLAIYPFVANAQPVPPISHICAHATSDINCQTQIRSECIPRIPDCTDDLLAELAAEGGWNGERGMTQAAADAEDAAAAAAGTGGVGPGTGGTGGVGPGTGSTGGVGPADGTLGVTWNSPVVGGNSQTIAGLITIVLDALIIIAIPIITLMIIYAGFLYVTARGNVEQTKRATTALTYAVIGGVLVVGAVAITGIIEQTIGEFRT